MDQFESFGISSGTCSAFSPEQFNQQFSSSNKKLFIMNFNIRSFNANIGEFSLFLDELCRIPDIIILTETWNSDDLSAEIDKYKSYHCNRPNTGLDRNSFQKERIPGTNSFSRNWNWNAIPFWNLERFWGTNSFFRHFMKFQVPNSFCMIIANFKVNCSLWVN